MKPIKMLGLAALAALMAMAFVGASSAMAESTALCNEDGGASEVCPEGHLVKNVHETSGGMIQLLSSVLNVSCGVLFSGEVTTENLLGNPLEINGHFTYSLCTEGCTVEETSPSSHLKLLKEGHETGSVTGEGTVKVHCGTFINCTYKGTGLKGTAKGPLLSSGEEPNGSVTLNEQITTGSGLFCPEKGKLDLLTGPLVATYITK